MDGLGPVCFRESAVNSTYRLPSGKFLGNGAAKPEAACIELFWDLQFSRMLELVATRWVWPLLARKCSLTLPYYWRMPGGIMFRGIQDFYPSWSLSKRVDFLSVHSSSEHLWWDCPQNCVTPFWLYEGKLGWALLSLQLWNEQETCGTTKRIFAVWWEKAWFCLVCQEVFLQGFEFFTTISSENCNISEGHPPYFVDGNVDTFGEPMVFSIICQPSNLRVETWVYCS